MNEKQVVYLPLINCYHGASSVNVRIEENCGWVEVFNDYNEKMFSGGTQDFVRFLNDLVNEKFA